MPAVKSTKSKSTTDPRVETLLRNHRELVAQYPAATGAAKAQIVRKLNLVQMELDLLDAEYPYWEKPTNAVVRSYVHTPEELIDRIARLRAQMERTDRSEASKATAARELENTLKQAESRGIEIPAA